jgi:DNA primase
MDREEIERVRAANPIADVVGRYVELRPSGQRYSGFCPFHADRKSPSLVVYPESGRWWCFGACGEGGDVFDFVMKAEDVEFPEAVKRLGGGSLSPRKFAPPPAVEEREADRPALSDAHYALLTTAVEVYHAALLANRTVLGYTSDRGLDADTVREYKLGFAQGRLKRYLALRNWSDELAADMGLVDAKGREWFGGRLIFAEMRGEPARAVYLVGRRVPKVRGWGPKYLFLEGLPKPLYCQERVAGSREVFLVEGTIDCLLLRQWGYPAVGLLGAHMKREDIALLRGFARVYEVPNRDDAGRRLWKECKEAFGDRMKTVLVPEGMSDVGDLAQRAAGPARVFAELVDKAG